MLFFIDETGNRFAFDEDNIEDIQQYIKPDWTQVSELPPLPEPEPTIPQEISALAGLAVIDEFGMSEPYTAWATSPDRTFMERSFIDKATVWKRENAALTAAADALGITAEQMDAMFVRAKALEAVL